MKKDCVAIQFEDVKDDEVDMLIAMLADVGFEGFEEDGSVLKAYIDKEDWDEEGVKEVAALYSLAYKQEEMQSQNWNAVWESHFEPVIIEDFVAVRAHFHEAIPSVQYEIVITPKMSFGTGHHATTTMMIEQMRAIDFVNRTVFDFGTGTGILSILAEKLGAANILAIDNDEWSIDNSKENVERNSCSQIRLELRNDADVKRSVDVILANINRNIILNNFSLLYSQLNTGGHLLLSGLLADDEERIRTEASRFGLKHMNIQHRLQWISLLFSR